MATDVNFLFIITDQHRADHLGCYGNPIVRTPNLDSLAANGHRSERFYVATPICMPNRASIMTGRMPSVHGAFNNGVPLSLNQTTFVELMRDAGYDTALIGKSHLQGFTGLPSTNGYTPDETLHTPSAHLRDAFKDNRHGTEYDLEVAPKWKTPLSERIGDDFYGFKHVEVSTEHGDEARGDYLLWAKEQRADFESLVGADNALTGTTIDAPQCWRTAVPEELYPTTWVAERTKTWLRERDNSNPFFVQMSFPDPHHPFTPPGKYFDMYNPSDVSLPESFGKGTLDPVIKMHEAMRAGTDPRDNQNPFAVTEDEARGMIALTYGMITMVDDAIGGVLRELESLGLAENTVVVFTSDHGDFMGDHGLMLKLLLHYQGLIRVPFLWHDPTAKHNGAVDTSLSSSIDISATILARAGIQPFNGLQGRDLFGSGAPNSILVEEDSQRIITGFDRLQRVRTVVTDQYRMSLRAGEDWNELYDLKADPSELINRYDDAEYAAVRATLTEQMLTQVIDMQDRAPLASCRA